MRRIITETAWGPIVVGFILVLVGWLVPFLTVIQVIPSTFLLLFTSYAMSTLGLMMGVIGAARIVVKSRNASQKEANRRAYPWEKARNK